MFLDLKNALEYWRIWLVASVYGVVLQYRRTNLGVIWIAAGLVILIVVKAFLFTGVLNVPAERIVPNLAYGLALWRLYLGLVNGGCRAIISQRGLMLQRAYPLYVPVFSNIIKHSFPFAISFTVAMIIALFYAQPNPLLIPFALLGLAFNLAVAIPLGLILATLSLRFRDFDQTIQSVMSVTFFITPIIWLPEMAKGTRELLLFFNPFFHFMELVRDPMTGQPIDAQNWIVALFLIVATWLIAFLLFRVSGRRVLAWL